MSRGKGVCAALIAITCMGTLFSSQTHAIDKGSAQSDPKLIVAGYFSRSPDQLKVVWPLFEFDKKWTALHWDVAKLANTDAAQIGTSRITAENTPSSMSLENFSNLISRPSSANLSDWHVFTPSSMKNAETIDSAVKATRAVPMLQSCFPFWALEVEQQVAPPYDVLQPAYAANKPIALRLANEILPDLLPPATKEAILDSISAEETARLEQWVSGKSDESSWHSQGAPLISIDAETLRERSNLIWRRVKAVELNGEPSLFSFSVIKTYLHTTADDLAAAQQDIYGLCQKHPVLFEGFAMLNQNGIAAVISVESSYLVCREHIHPSATQWLAAGFSWLGKRFMMDVKSYGASGGVRLLEWTSNNTIELRAQNIGGC